MRYIFTPLLVLDAQVVWKIRFLGVFVPAAIADTNIFPEILHRMNGEGGVYTEAEGLQKFVVVQLVTASVHNHHTAVHKI